MSEELVGTVSVDSGQILLIDPCYITKDFEGEYDESVAKTELNYAACCNVTCDDLSVGEVGTLGVVTRSGYGDGMYPVYATRRAGRIVGIRIDFDPQEDF